MVGEKRTDRLDVPRQLRVQESLGRVVRRLAEQEQRTVGQQILVLLIKGVEQHCREMGKEVSGLLGQR
ncbi:MAG: hypothetical protein NVS9B14_06510 [Candidatus Acidiferrum sp.]